MRNLFQIADTCNDIKPVISVIKNGLIPLVQIIIPIALIVWGTFDLGKAVISSDESEVKKAQKILIKRFIYAAAIFFIVTFVTVLMNIISEGDVSGTKSGINCWNRV